MSRTHTPRQQVFAIIRLDADQIDLEHQATVTKVLQTEADANAEVQRLNQLNAAKGIRYVWQATRLFEPGSSNHE